LRNLLGHAGALLAVGDLALGGLDARHQALQPGDDAIDLLLVEAHGSAGHRSSPA
jgi:hypothetical protein